MGVSPVIWRMISRLARTRSRWSGRRVRARCSDFLKWIEPSFFSVEEAREKNQWGADCFPRSIDRTIGFARSRRSLMSRPLFLFAPGAGAPSSHPWMQRWKARLSTIGDVEAFDYDYMREGRRRPDPLPRLIAAHRQALVNARRGRAVILIGKSMGGRIGCHVSLEEEVEAIVCFGYPLCGGGDRSKLRDKVLRALETPILFVQGTRDSLCPLDLLETIRSRDEGADFSPCRRSRRSFLAGFKATASGCGRNAGGG